MENLPRHLQYVNETFNYAREIGVIHLTAKKDETTNRLLYIDDEPKINFISNNYMGLEDDRRVKDAAIEAVERFGIYTSISRTYLSFDHYLELEEKLEKVFELPTLLANTTTLGHFAYLPLIIGKNDAIIMDQFVHQSVQMAAQYLKGGGVYTEMIKHNQMNELENRIKELYDKYDKIWYLTDGVFSMHGDTAPLYDIEVLLNSYEKFHTYIDDAHGISWIGKNGKGFCFHKIAKHEKMHMICSLNKGFGATSSVMVFPNQKTKDLVRNCGGTLIFSTPTLHAGIAAASRIADIHLTEEIYERQMHLNERILLFKQKSKQLNLPFINFSHTPIFFLGLGNLENVFRFSKHIQKCGFITSVASAPSVPIKHSGLRISINYNQTLADIENLLNTIAEYMEDLERQGLFNREVAIKGFKMADRNRELELA